MKMYSTHFHINNITRKKIVNSDCLREMQFSGDSAENKQFFAKTSVKPSILIGQ